MQSLTLANIKTFVEEDPYNVDAVNSVGTPILTWCVFHRHRPEIEYLIAMGADVNMKDVSGNTPLHIAVIRGYTEIAKYLVECQANPNSQNTNGHTPLHLALLISQKTLNKSRELVNLLVPITNPLLEDVSKRNVLYYCDTEIFLRLSAHANRCVNHRDDKGMTLLMQHIRNIEIVKYLLAVPGLNINAVDANGNTALHYAAIYREEEIISLLEEHP